MGLRQTLRHEMAFVLVLAITLIGLTSVVVASQHWLRGVLIIASAFVVAGVARALLSDRRAGLLAVRGRMFDVACYFLLGGATIGFGVTAAALMGPG
jgi:hypothetical protein